MRASNLEVFGQSPADLVENQGHERLGATDLGWGHHEVEGCRSFAVDKSPIRVEERLAHRDFRKLRLGDPTSEFPLQAAFGMIRYI